MEDSDSSFSLSSLLCEENEACFDDGADEDMLLTLNNYNLSETDDEYIEILVETETSFGTRIHGSSHDCSTIMGNWLKCARLNAIRWILKTRSFFGFHYQTAYLSVTYFDRFLANRTINNEKSWAIPLLSVACLSLAAKMEEGKLPALSEFQVFQVEEYNFGSKVIQKMELLVLNTLQWRMGSITPFAYLHYFINKLCNEQSPPNNIVSRTVELILAATKEMNSNAHRPSVIAAAAVFVASDQRLTTKTVEFKMSMISSYGSLENKHVFSCYNLMKELEMKKFKIPKSTSSSGLSPIYSNLDDVFKDPSYTSIVGNKRKRLTFSHCDQNCGIPNEKRLR
ncbi:hypothetical protein HHK36_031023 [Tetracentron sinense]|uniref:Uncharacterized protein n=1 Tax=Tetracentron sinense TaxID=13715 RepID=A0A834YE08_TETSI|nr:hypothetical protein HHK36_031023 [Tetracentron sinense]